MYLTEQDLTMDIPLKRLNVYDFDGVLASPFEEALFTLPATPLDAEFVRECERLFGLDLSLESARSARYICMQACMLAWGWGIKPGEIRPERGVPYHVLTARCDRFAIARMHEFIKSLPDGHKPIKIMQVDHLPKGAILNMLLEKHPDIQISFYDDNPNHIQSAQNLGSDRLDVFYVDNKIQSLYMDASTYYKNHILDRIL